MRIQDPFNGKTITLEVGHHRQCQGEDSGQGGHLAQPATLDFHREAARGWSHSLRLQHSEGEHLHHGEL
jgi:hypothetical protein